MPRWARAGLWAAALSGFPSTAWTLSRRGDISASTEALGADLLELAGVEGGRLRRLVVAGAAHVGISLVWARLLRRLGDRPPLRASSYGIAAGLAIGLLDLKVVGRRLPRVSRLELGPQLADHAAFGAVVGCLLSRSGQVSRPGAGDPATRP
jgi:hypothetical protein